MVASPLSQILMDAFSSSTSVGVAQTLACLGSIYAVLMTWGVLSFRLPRTAFTTVDSSSSSSSSSLLSSSHAPSDDLITPSTRLLPSSSTSSSSPSKSFQFTRDVLAASVPSKSVSANSALRVSKCVCVCVRVRVAPTFVCFLRKCVLPHYLPQRGGERGRESER